MISTLKDLQTNDKMEGELLRKKLTRQLYKMLGDPRKEDFPDIYETAGCGWKKMSGYTQDIGIMTPMSMEIENGAPIVWNIKHASLTKVQIVERYIHAGWHCEVQAYNVLCDKYVKHPQYDNLWVRFYSSRDCNKYEYILEEDE